MNGDLLQAAACYEKELGYLLRNSPSGIGSIFQPASELEEGTEEMDQGADGSTLRELPDPGADRDRKERKGTESQGAWNSGWEGEESGKAGVPQSEIAKQEGPACCFEAYF